MGKMKEKNMKDWIKEAQDEYQEEHHNNVSMIYNDLIEIDKLDDDSITVFALMQDTSDGLYEHIFRSDDIEYINGVCLTYRKEIKDKVFVCQEDESLRYRYITVPFDKVLFSYYETRSAK